jgi:hypothetical protein
MTKEDLNHILKKASFSANRLSFKEFYDIMTKNFF